MLGAFQTVNFFDNWHVDRLFLSLAVRKKSSNFTHIINLIRVKNENCELLQILCPNFLVALSPETKKTRRVET